MKNFFFLIISTIVVLFILGFGVSVMFFKFQTNTTPSPSVEPDVQPTPIVLIPPSQALKGTITSISVPVERIPWDSTAHIPATATAIIYQGDEIIAGNGGSASIVIPSVMSMNIGETADVIFSNLLSEKITIRQKSGLVEYNNESVIYPLSLRATGALLELSTGSAKIAIDGIAVRISMQTGSGTLGYVNNENITNVWDLAPNDTAEINDDTGIVKTTGKLR